MNDNTHNSTTLDVCLDPCFMLPRQALDLIYCKDDLGLLILLPPPLKRWDHRQAQGSHACSTLLTELCPSPNPGFIWSFFLQGVKSPSEGQLIIFHSEEPARAAGWLFHRPGRRETAGYSEEHLCVQAGCSLSLLPYSDSFIQREKGFWNMAGLQEQRAASQRTKKAIKAYQEQACSLSAGDGLRKRTHTCKKEASAQIGLHLGRGLVSKGSLVIGWQASL